MSARALRSNKKSVGDAIRECVVRGSVLPAGSGNGAKAGGGEKEKAWEREIAVMVGSVVGGLGR